MQDGTVGASSGDGLQQCIKETGATDTNLGGHTSYYTSVLCIMPWKFSRHDIISANWKLITFHQALRIGLLKSRSGNYDQALQFQDTRHLNEARETITESAKWEISLEKVAMNTQLFFPGALLQFKVRAPAPKMDEVVCSHFF